MVMIGGKTSKRRKVEIKTETVQEEEEMRGLAYRVRAEGALGICLIFHFKFEI